LKTDSTLFKKRVLSLLLLFF